MSDELLIAHRYSLIDRIGQGGMGEVWRCHDQVTGQTLAVKILRPPVSAAPAAELRFQREVQAMARLNHPRVVPIIDAGSDPNVGLFFVMVLQSGRPLHEAGKGWNDWFEMWPVVDQILGTLAHAHSHAVIHRDIKPDNILVDDSGEAVLLDFGVARLKDRARSGTSAYDLLGTVDYAAPEQATGNRRRIGPWTDLYCFAIVLYEIICGRVPFWAASPVQSLIMRLDSGCPELNTRPGFATPVGLWDVLNKMMQPEPLDRFRNAADVRAAFASLSKHTVECLTPPLDGLMGQEEQEPRHRSTEDQAGSLVKQKIALLKTSFKGTLGNRPPEPPLRTTTLVGRDEQMLQLSRGLGRWVQEPQPGVMVLSGPRGSGKSRLVRELLSPFIAQGDVEGHYHRWRSGSSMRETALSVMGGIGLHQEVIRDHVEWWLQGHGYEDGGSGEMVEWLIGMDEDTPEARQISLFSQFLRLCCAVRPFILTLDSVPILDGQTLGVTRAVRHNQLPIIVIITTTEPTVDRNHAEPPWLKEAIRYLGPLERLELMRIVDQLVDLPEESKIALVEDAKGNPKQLFQHIYQMRRDGLVVPAWPRWQTAPPDWDPPTMRNDAIAPLQSLDMQALGDDDLF